ncbi:diguanylate cyclase [Streptomyces sp. NRRL B-1677]|uniref:GGDEF domain-containing protein n=1 Tax=Streptomyces sp. NRRL B-1677 TaxID=2682966 RepID=UPI001892AE72|nr:GGDEF domain-containing protein [Streptomyces sp. NRRL B-1677]MBF6045964.1 diguanylate cyclase [Streptomyces sp. NRRL B-1677]
MDAFDVLSAGATAGPLVAGWSVHTLWMRRRLAQERLDALTGVPARELFTFFARRDLRRLERATVLVVDLDGFKAVNDTHGHAAGDAVLVAVAGRLRRWAVSRGGSVGRLGGDEFAATAFVDSPAYLSRHLSTLDASLREPVLVREKELAVGASIGAFIHTGLPRVDLTRALRRADEAMYAAKREGGGWRIATGPIPGMTTTNGRRTGRPGTTPLPGGAR